MRGFAEATINIRALEANASFHTIDRNLKFHLQVSLKSEGIIVLQDNLHFVKPVFRWDHVIKITCEPSLSLPEPRSRSQSQSAEATPPIAAQTGVAVYSKFTISMGRLSKWHQTGQCTSFGPQQQTCQLLRKMDLQF